MFSVQKYKIFLRGFFWLGRFDLLQNHFSDRLVTGSLGWRVRFKDASACIDVGSWAALVES